MAKRHTGCCEPFKPSIWENKEITWNNKLFIKDRVRCFFHRPLNIKNKIMNNMQQIKDTQAMPENFVMLFDHNSKWRSDMYLAVNKKIPGVQMTTLSGTFLSKVFEGPYKNAHIWTKQMYRAARSAGYEPKKVLYYYTTCPKCAKQYGINYVVLFAVV